VNPDGRAVDLTVMKEDEYVLILEDPVLYSGASIIHVMKKTGRFFWSKCSYSEILKEDDSTVRVGKLILKAQR